jgi:ABC-type bacteriocin/lantibiotic exporter with double-glycine peptidase domain
MQIYRIITRLQRVLNLLTTAERHRLYYISIAVVCMSFMELIGIVSILPFMTVVTNQTSIHSNRYLSHLYVYCNFQSDRSFLLGLGSFAFITLVVSNVLKGFSSYLLLQFAHMQNFYLSRRVFNNYLNQPYEFFLKRNSSDLTKNVLSEVSQVVNGVFVPLLRAGGRLFSAFFIFIVLVFISPELAFIVSLTLGISYFLIYSFLKKKIARTGKESILMNRIRTRVVNEAGGGIKEIKLLNKESSYLSAFDVPSMKYAKVQTYNAMIGDISKSAMETIAFGGIILIVIYLLANSDKNHAIPMISLYALAGYKLMPSLQEVFNCVTKIKFHIHSVDILFESLNMETFYEVKNKAAVTSLKFNEKIVLRDVNFNYSGSSRNVLTDINLTIGLNTSIGIIGPTGSGKTTIVDLILGLLTPVSGELVIDDVVVSSTNLSSWQKNIGYVPQSIYLSDDTILANIAFGSHKDHADLSKAKNAARMAQLDRFIEDELPDGYQTIVGERGVRLSGGQRQRIGIARALYHDPKLIVFDEATSALDSLTEKEVINAINSLLGHKTLIMIAHRLSTIQKCDHVILINKGHIVASGNYDNVIEYMNK